MSDHIRDGATYHELLGMLDYELEAIENTRNPDFLEEYCAEARKTLLALRKLKVNARGADYHRAYVDGRKAEQAACYHVARRARYWYSHETFKCAEGTTDLFFGLGKVSAAVDIMAAILEDDKE